MRTVKVMCYAGRDKPVFHVRAGNNRPVNVTEVERALKHCERLSDDDARKLLLLHGIDYDKAREYARVVAHLDKCYEVGSDWMQVRINPNMF